MWYHLALNKKVFLCIVCISVLTYPDIRLIYGQEKFLLTEAEMPGFELRRQSNRSWEIGEGLRNDRAIEQWWQASGTNSNYGIQYCEFDSAPEALSGTAYKAI